MGSSNQALIAFLLFAATVTAVLVWRPTLVERRAGKALALLLLLVLPAIALTAGTNAHLEQSKTTSFCLSCHVMEPYGESLWVDDTDYLPAAHFQNKRVDRDHACYTCHTTYTMFGGFNSKMQGMKHLWVNYVGPIPEQISLYEPFKNRECLHCHGGSRIFEEKETHTEFRAELESNETSCLDCHDLTHPIEELEDFPRWQQVSR